MCCEVRAEQRANKTQQQERLRSRGFSFFRSANGKSCWENQKLFPFSDLKKNKNVLLTSAQIWAVLDVCAFVCVCEVQCYVIDRHRGGCVGQSTFPPCVVTLSRGGERKKKKEKPYDKQQEGLTLVTSDICREVCVCVTVWVCVCVSFLSECPTDLIDSSRLWSDVSQSHSCSSGLWFMFNNKHQEPCLGLNPFTPNTTGFHLKASV